MRIDFYHLTASPVEQVLAAIADKLTGAGERLLVVSGPEHLAELDRLLWTQDPASFLPHARAGQARDADQPVLLSSDPVAANGARNVALADGQWREEALGFDRVFHFFDAATIDAARAAWRTLKAGSGAELHYWKQVEGRWIEGP